MRMKKMVSLALCLGLSLSILSGCSDNSEPFAEKSYTPDAQVREIRIEVEDREIAVSPSGDGQVHMQYAENSKEFYDISVSDDGVLTMTSASDKAWTDYVGVQSSDEGRKISLQVPDAMLENLTISTTNEDITVSGLTVNGTMDLTCNGGQIAFENVGVGSALRLTGKNGDISGSVLGSMDDFAIQTEIKKGETNLPESTDGGEKTLYAANNNGDVQIEFGNE